MLMQPFADAFPSSNIRHHFVAQAQGHGVYAKELHVPAGWTMLSHSHPYDHLSILATGSVEWISGGVSKLLRGPCAVTVEAGVEHSLVALSDAVWFCVHPTAASDAGVVDAVILSKGGV